ncbi:peptidylprolyl isomerase [Roseateles saccharophilus]|uniref:Peptidyl-prolyl cis-trans isomerase n=1 Tax=Roseateles saccharophilus TaxID=304 RepID=A0A4R3VEY7_ROSSA|nr:peptidylprolyl isomerase [Roseateles saccharophilus]MDG0832515.1 peptidyl-prolyl cis-trans isomerase [Roseateles saccharophilus]TCV03976.1 peptidyl-prolyl cis-trans isomerase A (cyclophilin A) [Roseateles saccharophilus]
MTKTALFLAALLAAAATSAQTVKLQTSEGDIRIELDAEKAPRTVANFLQYVKSGHYNGVVFHRVIANFMVQTGGYDARLNQRPTKAPIPLESHNGLSNLRGSVAMARTGDPNSATSQFFINVVDNLFLDGEPDTPKSGYAVFGQVVDGMDVVDRIRAVETKAAGMHENLPVKPIFINKALVEPVKK